MFVSFSISGILNVIYKRFVISLKGFVTVLNITYCSITKSRQFIMYPESTEYRNSKMLCIPFKYSTALNSGLLVSIVTVMSIIIQYLMAIVQVISGISSWRDQLPVQVC